MNKLDKNNPAFFTLLSQMQANSYIRIYHILLIGVLTFPSQVFSQIRDSSYLFASAEIYFDSDESLLDKEDSLALNRLYLLIQKIPGIYIQVQAHTDGDGSHEYNLALSQDRMNSAKAFMLSRGIDESKLETSFYGKNLPIASNSTSEGKAKNRRCTVAAFILKKLFRLEGNITGEMDSGSIEKSKIYLHSKSFKDSTYTNEDGSFSIWAPLNEVAGVDLITKGYLPMTEMFHTRDHAKKPLSLLPEKLVLGKKALFSNIRFVGDKSIVLEEYRMEWKNILRFMQVNNDQCIEIIGHVNLPNRSAVDSTTFEYNLSVARSKAIHDLIVQQGISPDRMRYSARGNWEMLFPKARSSKEMQANRRVEIKIISCHALSEMENAELTSRFTEPDFK